MPALYYWRPDNYRRDRDFGFGYHLNQNSPVMAALGKGDSVWAFTRRKRDGVYVLAAELVVRAVTRNPPNYRYGKYRIWGDMRWSRYFDVDVGPNVEPLIRELSISAHGERLGQSFQGNAAVRAIAETDHRLLAYLARDLQLLDRVGFYPEDRVEAQLVHGDKASKFVIREEGATYAHRLEYLYYSLDPQRAQEHVRYLQELYGGRCQVCLYDPWARYRLRTCHVHHIQWLSRGGVDELENIVLVCPNHHAAIHRDDASFDYLDLSFAFSNGQVEKVLLNTHLPKAS